MKRADLKVGEEYAVAAPSTQFPGGHVRRARVLAAEPYEKWSNWSGRPATLTAVEKGPGVLVLATAKYLGWDEDPDQVKLSEKTVLPLGQFRMLWSEYRVLAKEHEDKVKLERVKENLLVEQNERDFQSACAALGVKPFDYDEGGEATLYGSASTSPTVHVSLEAWVRAANDRLKLVKPKPQTPPPEVE